VKSRVAIITLLALFCLAMLWAAWSKGRQVAELRDKQKDVLVQLSAGADAAPSPAVASEPPKPSADLNSSELLRLLAEVARLTRRKQELSPTLTENQRLKARLAYVTTNAQAALPADYMRKSAAKNAGYATPQSAMETFLWAVQSKSITNLLDAFSPEEAVKMQQSFQNSRQNSEDFVKGAAVIPGFRILRTELNGPDQAKVYLEIIPGTEPTAMDLKLVNGQWKLTSL